MPKEELNTRPPVVAVLGHVDHGKTSLLDYIRQTRVAAKEAGGITQRIGAYQAEVRSGKEVTGKITFIDTPGHEAFSKMRSRGAMAADLVILVVAADDGVMPQTIESINHINAAKAPFLVAITKSDLPGGNIERVKKQLSENGVFVEGYGGDVVAIPVSSKTGEGVKELLEMILLLSQIQEIKADPEGPLEGIVIESRRDKMGSVGTIIVKNGTLKVGEMIGVDGITSKVRGMMDEYGNRVKDAVPGQPVEVIGFENPPSVGAKISRPNEESSFSVSSTPANIVNFSKETEGKLRIILKADTLGSLEAVEANLPADIALITKQVGDVSESDVLLAKSTKANVFGFRIKIPQSVQKLAENEGVSVKTYEIIYQLFEDLENEVLKKLDVGPQEKVLGKAQIVTEFVIGGSRVAGCRLVEGRINKNDQARLERGGKVLGSVSIVSMKQRAKDVEEVAGKEEFGVVINPLLDFKAGDMLVSFRPILNE